MELLLGEPVVDGALLPAVEEAHTGSYDGEGASHFRNGNTYVGHFKERTMSGRGEYAWTGLGVTYAGEFERNRMRGEGKYSWPDGSTYEGQVFDGLRDGYGVFTGPHGICRYSGEWKAGHRHGKGKLEYDPNGVSYYEGEWVTDEKHGQGKMVYTSGNVYEGQWKRNVKSGYGEMRWASTAEVYKGQWADGLQEGEGEHEWLRPQNDGHALQLRERYAGKWHKGQRSGQGIFVYANGSAYRGGWRANLKHGEGVFMFEDGSSCAGLFEDDRMLDASSVMQPAADPVAKLDVSEMVAAEKDPELAAKHVVNTLVRFHSEVKRTYRYYAAMHCPPSEAFTLALEQLDTLLHDIKVPTLDLPLADAHRVFFGSLLRPGAGQPKLTASPEPSVNQLVSEAMSARQSAIDMHAPARPILLREFTSGLVRLAHARHAQLPSLAQRVHELMTAHLLPNARATPSHGASTIERERAQSVGGDELELHWPAVRAVRDAFLDQLHPIWLACAAPRAEDTPAHRRPRAPDNRASDETCRCREFAQLLRNTRLLPAGMTVADALVATALKRYDVALATSDDATEQLAQMLEVELTHEEFCRGICHVAMLHHAAHDEPAPLGAESADAHDSAAAPAAADDAGARDTPLPLRPGADAPPATVVAHFLEWRLLPAWRAHRLEEQIRAMAIPSAAADDQLS